MLAAFTVTETVLDLEPVTADPFIAVLEKVGPSRPAGEPARPSWPSQRNLVALSLPDRPDGQQ